MHFSRPRCCQCVFFADRPHRKICDLLSDSLQPQPERIPFSSSCNKTERREVERLLSKVLNRITDEDVRGRYLPLRGSWTHLPMPMGMSAEQEEELEAKNLLMLEPDSSVLLCSGIGRHWPEARGLFPSNSGRLVAWVNGEDHLRLTSLQPGGNLQEAFCRLSRTATGVEAGLAAEGHQFSRNGRLGYITTSPSNLGIGLYVNVLIRLPLLSLQPDLKETCRDLGLQVCAGTSAGVLNVAAVPWEHFRKTEVELVSAAVDGCAKLVQLEQALEWGS